MNKKWLSLGLLMAVAVVTTACAGNIEKENIPVSTSDSTLEAIQQEGVLRIGTEGTYAPFTFHDESGALTGFDVDVAKEVAKRLGVETEFIETKWDGMFAGLDSKRFDMVANEVTIREDRKEKYDFSDPYIVSRAVLIVNKENQVIKTFEDLKGKKFGQSLTSNLGDLAKSYGAEIVSVDGFNQAIDLITSKRIDGTINDSLSFLDYKKQKPDAPIMAVAEQETKDESGFLFNKGNEDLIQAVNKALSEMKADGTYEEISLKWFGADVSK